VRSRLAAALLVLALAGCRHRGAAWDAPPLPAAGPIELFVLGQARESASTRALARELGERTREAEAQGRTPVIVSLGLDLGRPGSDGTPRCPDPGELFQDGALRELADVMHAVVEHGGAAHGLPGPDGWRCGLTGFEAAVEPLPYQQAGVAYVLRLRDTGELSLVSSCERDSCSLAPADPTAVLELVLLDTSFWHYDQLVGDDLEQALLAQQRSLLDALREQADAPPRVLLSPIPIESAGSHGLGGRRQRTAYHYAPPSVQQAIASGLFVGVIGALERDLQVSEDLSNAIVRGERTFISKPIFGVITGAAGGAGHTLPTSRGMSMLPDLHSEHTGFASLTLTATHVQLRMHAKVAGRWRVATLALPLRPEPHAPLRETPTIQPCPSCDPQRGASDGDVFVPRGPRQH
jgi:hypothetical protein